MCTMTMAVIYGGHSADLLFHIIISELQYIIPDSSPKILSWREIYYLGAKYIYWAHLFIGPRLFILGAFILSAYAMLLDFPSTPTPTR